MDSYEHKVLQELNEWQLKMTKKPTITNRFTKGIQNKINKHIPEKVHNIATGAIKNMVRTVLIGSEYTTKPPLININLEEREKLVKERLNFYRKTAVTTGAGTGVGGFLLGLADFPILLSIKMKFLFETASIYGFNVKDYRERLYILMIFELAFSSDERRLDVYNQILNWEDYIAQLPFDMNDFDWRQFQQEYRDYIDLAKLLQMLPGIGAAVGAIANYQLLDKLGVTAMNSYRLRLKSEIFTK